MRISDWSSDVCSSDLEKGLPHALGTIYERTNASLEAAGFGGMGSASKPRQGSRVVQVPVGHAVGAANAGTGDNGGLWVPDGGIVEHANGLQQAGGGGQAGQFAAGQFAQAAMY